jgi:hypothetical protein
MGLWLIIHAGVVLKIARQKYTLHSVVPSIVLEFYSRKRKSPLDGLFSLIGRIAVRTNITISTWHFYPSTPREITIFCTSLVPS